MKARTSENVHEFQERLFGELKAYALQGLLMDANHQFTAAVEAVEYEKNEDINKIPFTEKQIYAKYKLAKAIGVPLYLILYKDGKYVIRECAEAVKENIQFKFKFEKIVLTEAEFITWWGEKKGTIQNKPLNNGGESRIGETIFDGVLRKYGYEWGGNIDGFVLSEDGNSVRYIIDCISVSAPNLGDEPSHYINSSNPKHGPRYEGWYAAVKLANTLNVPHVLLTLDKKNPQKEHVGLAIIKKLSSSPARLDYMDNIKPNDRIIVGIEQIKNEVEKLVKKSAAPEIVEKQ